MDLDWIWKAIVIVLAGTFLLRIAGRKSISQMTLAQTVLMIGIGSLLVQPLAGKNLWTTLAVGTMLVLTLIVIEYAQVKSDSIEKLITGRSKVLIQDGVVNEKNLRKLRFTVDQLEMKLRQQNVTSINDVKFATLEPNGQVGCELKPDSQPATKKELYLLDQRMQQIIQLLNPSAHPTKQGQTSQTENIFSEVANNSHSTEPPKHLQ